jgi:signal transduction histidine kinase
MTGNHGTGAKVTRGQRFRRLSRSVTYLLLTLLSVLPSTIIALVLGLSVISVAIGGIGLVLVPLVVLGLRKWAGLHRRLAGWLLEIDIVGGSRKPTGGILAIARAVAVDQDSWRALGWVVVHVLIGFPFGVATLTLVAAPVATLVGNAMWWSAPVGRPMTFLGIALTNWGTALAVGLGSAAVTAALAILIVPRLALVHAQLTRMLLGRPAGAELADRINELTESRSDALDAHRIELSRIERDLHDGTQARLVSIAMRLGIARDAMTDDPATTAKLLEQAQNGAEEAMTELRAIIRSMYPPILADRGLAGALRALAAESPVPARIEVGELGPLQAAVEATAYFAVSEALTNVAKHSGASVVVVNVWQDDGRLRVEITDDGRGGVDEGKGSGVRGIRRRVAAMDGTASMNSPVGGPTVLEVQLPCG